MAGMCSHATTPPIFYCAKRLGEMCFVDNFAARAPRLLFTCHFFHKILYDLPHSSEFLEMSMKGPMGFIPRWQHGKLCLGDLVDAIECKSPTTQFKLYTPYDWHDLSEGYYKGWAFDKTNWPVTLHFSKEALERFLWQRADQLPESYHDDPTTEFEFSWEPDQVPISIALEPREEENRVWLNDELGIRHANGECFVHISRTDARHFLHQLLCRRSDVKVTVRTVEGKPRTKTLWCNGFWRKLRMLRILDDNARQQHCFGEFYWSPMGK